MDLPKVLFVLPAAGASGGANSVVQEAAGLARIGATIGIAINAKNYDSFRVNYPELARQRVELFSFTGADQLAAVLVPFDIVVATVNNSISDIADARAILAKTGTPTKSRVAYYVQDYEPLFYEPNSDAWRKAYASYTALPDAVLFAKTKWLQDIVYANHGVRVAKVSPSINHDIYFPSLDQKRAHLNVVAMLRPKTPRRAPYRTLRIMEALGELLPVEISLTVFGTDTTELERMGIELSHRIANRGHLKQHEVPALFRSADLFLDLSDYQAFGRTGLESMTCGVIPVVPVLGGTAEYAEHGRNAYVVDTRSDSEIIQAVVRFVEQSPQASAEMRQNALETAARFTVGRAALSELKLFREMLSV